jgi:hypothetical protein
MTVSGERKEEQTPSRPTQVRLEKSITKDLLLCLVERRLPVDLSNTRQEHEATEQLRGREDRDE